MDQMEMSKEEQHRFVVLLSVTDLGGSGKREYVLDNIEDKHYVDFQEHDFEYLESGNIIRWETALSYIRKHLVIEGHLDDSVPGIWRITEKGRRYFLELCRKVVELSRGEIEFAYRLHEMAFDRAREILLDLPHPEDFNKPPKSNRILLKTYRILRDTELARSIKGSYQSECQLCGVIIEFVSGMRYAEAHHIKPFGSPHNGPDVGENIICVCPNHHAQLDYGAIKLEKSSLSSGTLLVMNISIITTH